MTACTYCNKPFSLFHSMWASGVTRCKDCAALLNSAEIYWKNELWKSFESGEAPEVIENRLNADFNRLRMPRDIATPIIGIMQYLKTLSEIQAGNIPIARTSIHLDSDEIAHFTIPTNYYKQNKETKIIAGTLIGTNKSMYFVSEMGRDSAKLSWNNVLEIDRSVSSPSLHIRVSQGVGGGSYYFRSTSDALYIKTLIDTLVRLWKRQLVLYKEQRAQGAIPEHVKNAVFHRDGGKCVQCGSPDYPEFDHRVPRSKGGQNTVDNIQILCRRCNLKKGARI